MCSTNERNLSLNGDTFAILKEQFDKILNRTVGNMEMKGADDAVITLKLSVSLEKSSVSVGDDIKEVTKPTFKHDISSVMQVKDKVSGQTTDDYALVWDDDEGKYVLRKIENGQMSFDDFDSNGNPIYEADYHEVPALEEGARELPEATESEDSEEEEDTPTDAEDNAPDASSEFKSAADDVEDDITTPYGWLKQFVGTEMRVTESMGNFTVRTSDNKVVLSSATDPNNVFYCAGEKLSGHVGHVLTCKKVYNGEEDAPESINIACSECGEEVFRLYPDGCNVEPSDEEKAEMLDEAADAVDTLDGEDNYPYEQPEE